MLYEHTFCKLSNNISCTLNDGLKAPSVCSLASRATRNTLLVISPAKMKSLLLHSYIKILFII